MFLGSFGLKGTKISPKLGFISFTEKNTQNFSDFLHKLITKTERL